MPTIKGIIPLHPEGGYTFGEKKLHKEFGLAFIVKADTFDQGPQAILATVGLPFVGASAYSYESEFDLSCLAKSKKARRIGKRTLYWRVEVHYDNKADSKAQEDEETYSDPVDRPVEIEWDSVVEEIALWKDLDGNPIVNSAGERFPEPVTWYQVYPTCSISRYEASFTVATIRDFAMHVNDDTWFGVDAGESLCESIRARRVIEDGTLLWNVSYRFKFAFTPAKHQALILDQGRFYDAGPSVGRTPFLIEDPDTKAQIAVIGNLNGTGGAAAAGDSYYLEFRRAESADFDTLALV